jgi:hypothetical protein
MRDAVVRELKELDLKGTVSQIVVKTRGIQLEHHFPLKFDIILFSDKLLHCVVSVNTMLNFQTSRCAG